MARSGRVRVYIDADASGVRRGTAAAERSLRDLDSRGSRALRGLGTAAKFAGAAIGAGMVVELGRAVREAREANKVTAQTEAVIKSTGRAAKVTAKDVEELANSISLKAGIDDEAIQSAENLLLTFKNIRNETGKGNQIFNQATQIVTDMSVALGTDLKSASIQVGKALNDPTIGLTALQRVGVTFTAQQKEQIQALYEGGNALKAQKMILKELRSEFGGSAGAQADAFDKFKVSIENLEESLGKAIMPTLSKAAGAVAKFINQFRVGKGEGGKFRKELEKFGPTLKTIGTVAKDVWPVLRWQMKAAWTVTKFVVGNMASTIKKLVDAGRVVVGGFRSAWGTIKDIWRGGVSAIERFVNRIIDVINLIPGVEIGNVGGGGKKYDDPKGTQSSGGRGRGRRKTTKVKGRFMGARVTEPMAIVGEEAPRHPEYVLATNPAYRARNVGLWMQAAKEMGIPGFDVGGVIKNTPAAKLAGGAFSTAADVIGKLPSPGSLPGHLRGAGSFSVAKAKEFIRDRMAGLFSSDLGKITGAAGRALVPIGRALQRQGFQVGGHPAFGGATPGVHSPTSYHYQGRAIDVNWPNVAQEPARLNALYNTLAKSSNPTELFFGNRGIPTPVPDHHDHLHLAFARGGVLGSPKRGTSWINAGRTFSPDEAATLAWQAGASEREARLLSTKIIGESSGNPKAIGNDPGGTQGLGLWQITTGYNDDVIRRFGGRSAMLHPSGVPNAKAAIAILRRQGIGAWYAPSNPPGRILRGRIGGSGPGASVTAGGIGAPGASPSFVTSGKKKIKAGFKPTKVGGSAASSEDTQQAILDALTAQNELLRQQDLERRQMLNTSQSQYGVLAKAIADIASGQLGGRVGLGFQSPSYASGFARL